MTSISGDIAYYSNGYYYTTDGTAIPEQQIQKIAETSYIASTKPDTFEISAANETCTDGKDDGKIGVLSALGNMAKGIGKTIVNGVKGMVTDKEGNFSLGKTLLSVGTAALCIAVPAVGVAACAVGAVAGGVQVAKGAIAASQAETDAEAKEAWQNIGGGTFTAAVSVAGAKAGMKAVNKTSTAGLSGLDDAAAATAKVQGKTSAYSQLDKTTATLTQKATALGKDLVSSTKNQISNIKNNVKTAYSSAKQTKQEVKEINQMREANADAIAKQESGKTLTSAEEQAIKDWDNLGEKGYSESALNKVNKQNNLEFQKAEVKQARKSGDKEALKAAKEALSDCKKENSTILKIKNTISKALKETNTGEAITNQQGEGIIKTIKGTISKEGRSAVLKGLSEDKQAIVNAITATNKDISYVELVNKYGYNNVLEVLEVMAGYMTANEAI